MFCFAVFHFFKVEACRGLGARAHPAGVSTFRSCSQPSPLSDPKAKGGDSGGRTDEETLQSDSSKPLCHSSAESVRLESDVPSGTIARSTLGKR
ncbi:hypothetical protein [Salimicrobium flavidum]|uniref:hypothetical protein n=1 Tax=Salimicrobium flavidum TaxID=570947 RepID=UPI00117B60BC|nr:hypothetical protein [Salimicrobium flavidum]